ncbi:MAG: DUF5125 domain-containing protein [Tannerellaceae bacterium]|nr:DUF5125 domain-containing protein [Tannerellaceae bacterium]
MKRYKFLTVWAILSVVLFACDDDDDVNPGNPVIADIESAASAHFGDSISFSAHVADDQVPLSTLKAYLYYGEEVVQEVVIRTKTAGTYTGKIFAPFYANIPNGTATLRFALQNINMTISNVDKDIALSRPDFPYLTLETQDGEEYRMERTSLYNYAVTAVFPQELKAFIHAPKVGENGSPITFGWLSGKIQEDAESWIPFSSEEDGEYTVHFNTQTYAAGPFITLTFAGEEMVMTDTDMYMVDVNLKQNEEIEVTGIPRREEWWIDPDFFKETEDGNFIFQPADGKYRVWADFKLKYFKVEALDGDNLATLKDNGTGALWLLGDGAGKPSISNAPGWGGNEGLLIPSIGDKKFRISFVAGETISISEINFKFFFQKGWGGEFTNATLTTNSDIVFIGDGSGEDGDPLKRDPGNLGLVDGKPLTAGKTYVFTIDLSAGNNNGVLIVEEK